MVGGLFKNMKYNLDFLVSAYLKYFYWLYGYQTVLPPYLMVSFLVKFYRSQKGLGPRFVAFYVCIETTFSRFVS